MRKYLINDMPPQISDALRDKLLKAETATIGHRRHWGFMDPAIQGRIAKARIVGTAVTLSIPGQDSTLLHHALTLVRPGDVLVIDRLGDTKHACWGGLVTAAASAAGLAGAILDGVCTDPTAIEEFQFPLWCRGVSPITTRLYNNGGSLNHPIHCGGAPVRPGDAIFADENGVLVIPVTDIDEAADWAIEKLGKEPDVMRRLAAGEKLGHITGATKMVEAELALSK